MYRIAPEHWGRFFGCAAGQYIIEGGGQGKGKNPLASLCHLSIIPFAARGMSAMFMEKPAHRIFVEKYLNWDLVRERLDRYKNIGKAFPIDTLRGCSDKPPYYCHYLSWRLGTWQDEKLFEFLDTLLGFGAELKGWDTTRIPKGCEFDNFWGFIWELQVAALFAGHLKLHTEWKRDGPDFRVSTGSSCFFVECTTYRKSFGLEEFVREIFQFIDPQIKIEHKPWKKFSLPKGREIDIFLDNLFRPYLDPIFLRRKWKQTLGETPVIIHTTKSSNNFYVYLENPWAENHKPRLEKILSSVGCKTERYLDRACREVLRNKASANRIDEHHPNFLMVNYLLGSDWQIARALMRGHVPALPKPFDGFMLCACGIDSLPSFHDCILRCTSGHPIQSLVNNKEG
ncbi:hypothetical protein [Levilinea saccharolytica]|uniref:hypothetical protein n=1 Tax=Levilinea saccharolytica TaxID=229921 RepID=UPI0011BFA1BA|nr:hypothetical protein [Levilinea saccharolytica]GAP16646.1 hypothetical protein LSAC_00502 [Levilinea saccharolytica]